MFWVALHRVSSQKPTLTHRFPVPGDGPCFVVRWSCSSAGRTFLPTVRRDNTQGCHQSSSSHREARKLVAAPQNTKTGGTNGYVQQEVASHTIHGCHRGRISHALKLHMVQTNSGKKVPHCDPLVIHSFGNWCSLGTANGRFRKATAFQALSKGLVVPPPRSIGSFPREYLKSNYLLHNEWLFGFFWHLPVTNALKQLSFNLQKMSLLAFHLVKLFL